MTLAEAPPDEAARASSGYLRYVGRKGLGALGSLVFVVVLNFFLFRVLPGDPARTLGRGRFSTPEQLQEFNRTYGLDQPLPQQFLTFLKNTFTGDLGVSLRYRVPVSDLLIDRMWPTLVLVGTSTLLATVIGIWVGIRQGWRRGSTFDKTSDVAALTLYSMPEWWLGLLLVAVFGVGFGPIPGMFPIGGLNSVDADPWSLSGVLDTAWHLALPVLTLTLAYVAGNSLIMRSSLLEEISEDYLTTARAKGLRDAEVRDRHAVPNALLPTTAQIALNIGFVVTGATTVETVFSIPGLGLLATEALSVPDYWVLQGAFLVASAGVILANFAANLVYGLLDPRVRT